MTKSDVCFICGAEENLEDHHKIPQRMDGTDRSLDILPRLKSEEDVKTW